MFRKARLPQAALFISLAFAGVSTGSAALAANGIYMLTTIGSADLLYPSLVAEHAGDPLSTPLEAQCLSFGLYHEARGESEAGQIAVGMTILNRVRSNAYPNTICGVVYQNAQRKNRCQFSFACDDLDDYPRNARSMKAIRQLSKRLISSYLRSAWRSSTTPHVGWHEYTHYHRHDVSPSWSAKLHHLGRVGDHVFFRSERVVRRYRDKI